MTDFLVGLIVGILIGLLGQAVFTAENISGLDLDSIIIAIHKCDKGKYEDIEVTSKLGHFTHEHTNVTCKNGMIVTTQPDIKKESK